MPDVFTEGLPHNEGFIVSEANGNLSREQVTLVRKAAVVKAGTVLAKRDDGKYEQLDPASSEQPDLSATSVLGILCSDVDSTEAEAKGVIIERLAEVRDDDLIWLATLTGGQKTTAGTALLAKDIKIRTVATTVSTQTT